VILHDTATAGRPDIAALIGLPAPKTAIGCCGPAGMIDDFERASRDWPGERVHVERFVPPALPADPNARPYTLALARSQIETRVEPDKRCSPHFSISASTFRLHAAAAFAARARWTGSRAAPCIATACYRRPSAPAA
jgi:hypothetical protein